MHLQMQTATTVANPPAPWGITFRYAPPRNLKDSPEDQAQQAADNWAALTWALPGWEIRQVAGSSGQYLAFPPASLIQVGPEQPNPSREIVSRFNSLKSVPGTRDEELGIGVAEEVARRFLTRPGDPDGPDRDIVEELRLFAEADQFLAIALQKWRPGHSRLTALERLQTLHNAAANRSGGHPWARSMSPRLRPTIAGLRNGEIRPLRELHIGALAPGVSLVRPPRPARNGTAIAEPRPPISRDLRAYSFDPSLATEMETAPIHTVKIPVRWEDDLQPGPIGEYLEVVDIDPASQCAYAPVDLNHPYILAQDGLLPSEGNPQFHQQMVYAVAMNTIHRFELALGRPVFWSHLRPWLDDRPEERERFTPEARPLQARSIDPVFAASADRPRRWVVRDQMRYVQRLRIVPHARRDCNAYYSPASRALLFGYFPSADASGRDYPGGTVFTCLSHDIVAHETTHALVDGMHPYFTEGSNPDVPAFHEAFADIMALFQHFTYPEVLRHQIASSSGNLETGTLLGQLAQQFGRASGEREALRSYLVRKEGAAWVRIQPNPRLLETMEKPHDRGSILVSAVFDAFIDLYNHRVRDLLRIATGGSGRLPEGQIHPDLTNRLAREAAVVAEQVLQICIRAMDYLPPVDVTFGEFLRALITADFDLSPLGRENRIAFINAFRSWGIYPDEVTTLSEESLRWRPPDADSPLFARLEQIGANQDERKQIAADLISALDRWQPGSSRDEVFRLMLEAQAELHRLLMLTQSEARDKEEVLKGIDWRKGATFSVGNLRPARRIGPRGEFRTEMVVEIVQRHKATPDIPGAPSYRGGATLIFDLRTLEPRYVIYKRLYAENGWPKEPGGSGGTLANRFTRQSAAAPRPLWLAEGANDLTQHLAATYGGAERQRQGARDEPFAFVHGGFA